MMNPRFLLPVFCFFSFISPILQAHIPTEQDTMQYRKQLDGLVLPKCVSIPEGAFVYSYNPTVAAWLEKPLTSTAIQEIQDHLNPHLKIPFTKEGFTQAVAKPEGDAFGEVSYSAIWVRDCVWHYYGLKLQDPKKAARLIGNLVKFYSTDDQLERFLSVIENPQVADPDVDPKAHMNVPLIRFSSKTLSHHQFENKDQEWNHIQFDSHGLFLLALSDALTSGILPPEKLKVQNYALLALFPGFLTQTNYADKPDAGPWEERLQYNASSVGLMASGIRRIMEVLHANPLLEQGLQQGLELIKTKERGASLLPTLVSALSSENIQHLYEAGLSRVERNLELGGEAPNLTGEGIDRRADAALLFLCLVEHTPFFDNPQKIREILALNSSLIGPYGIYRYRYDPYQTCNYWITRNVVSPIQGPETPLLESLNWWKKGYMPHLQPYDAQWFFDSCFADLYYHLAMGEKENEVVAYYLKHGDIHLKRALGQLTGPDSYAANGQSLAPFQLPESINTVSDSFYPARPMPSPISPLSWAKASLIMALHRAKLAHAHIENREQ